jgi:hypothetical protein
MADKADRFHVRLSPDEKAHVAQLQARYHVGSRSEVIRRALLSPTLPMHLAPHVLTPSLYEARLQLSQLLMAVDVLLAQPAVPGREFLLATVAAVHQVSEASEVLIEAIAKHLGQEA